MAGAWSLALSLHLLGCLLTAPDLRLWTHMVLGIVPQFLLLVVGHMTEVNHSILPAPRPESW